MEPVWKLIGKGRFYSAAAGTGRTFDLDIQDWALHVQAITYAIYVTGKSHAANARAQIDHLHGATADVNAMTLLSTPIALIALTSPLPTTLLGVAQGVGLPYFRTRVTSDSAVATEEWWEGEIWVGGRPF